MRSLGDYISKLCHTLLEKKQQAIFTVVVLAMLPFASWLSVSLVALITLRKGARPGFEVMIPAMVAHFAPLLMLMPVKSAIINTLLAYLLCYFSALVLRQTSSWRLVGGFVFSMAIVASLLMQLLAPDFIIAQFEHFKSLLIQYQEYQQLIDSSTDGLGAFVLAQLFFGVQLFSVIASAIISLLFARSIQAKLFLPGGFGKELHVFRGGKIALTVLVFIALGAYYDLSVAINLLPVILSYFLLAGFNLFFCIMARRRQAIMIALLVMLILIKPVFLLFAYILLGALDSTFNFRLYLPKGANEST